MCLQIKEIHLMFSFLYRCVLIDYVMTTLHFYFYCRGPYVFNVQHVCHTYSVKYNVI